MVQPDSDLPHDDAVRDPNVRSHRRHIVPHMFTFLAVGAIVAGFSLVVLMMVMPVDPPPRKRFTPILPATAYPYPLIGESTHDSHSPSPSLALTPGPSPKPAHTRRPAPADVDVPPPPAPKAAPTPAPTSALAPAPSVSNPSTTPAPTRPSRSRRPR